jgi:hypothetical protein
VSQQKTGERRDVTEVTDCPTVRWGEGTVRVSGKTVGWETPIVGENTPVVGWSGALWARSGESMAERGIDPVNRWQGGRWLGSLGQVVTNSQGREYGKIVK